MISLRNIGTIAKFERKTLFRSWFFRIFAIITLLFLFGLNMGAFAEGGASWTLRAIPANLPYINVLFVNVAQAIIAVFLASDFLRRDKKLDTTEVIYARPISNGEYVVGKTLGIMTLFIGLVLVVLSMALVVNLIIKDTPVVWEAYLYYTLLISVPTLVFILGLSFFLMILFKNQAITFVVLLGYIGLTLFYFKDKLYGLLDYMAFNLPFVYSDFVGFADFDQLLLQRLAYLFMGIGFIFATIRFINRLPQVGRLNMVNLSGFIIFLAAGLFLGYQYYSGKKQFSNERAEIVMLNDKYVDFPITDVLSNNITLVQHAESLELRSEITLRSKNYQSIDTAVFSLNSGFQLDSIIGASGPVPFEREKHLVFLSPENGISGRRSSYTFYYHGVPSESNAYLDIQQEQMKTLKRSMVANFSKKPGIIDDEYILLTSEMLWYPMSGVGFNHVNFRSLEPDFVKFSLNVTPEQGLTAVAAGRVEESDGHTSFYPENDLNRFPLVIGPFEKRSITVDDVDYNLYLKPDHDYFSEFFTSLGDTLGVLIKEAKDDYEYDELDLYYSFNRINIVEVPAHFHAYERAYMHSTEYIQPEMIFLPEKGAGLNPLDFNKFVKAEERRNKERENVKSQDDIESDLFKNFIVNTLFSEGLTTRGGRGRGSDQIITTEGHHYKSNPYCAFPLYYSYIAAVSSDTYPIFNSIIEQYLKEGFEISFRQGFVGGVTDNEKANMAMKKSSVAEIMNRKNSSLVSATIYQAGSYVINALKNRVGSEEFDTFLYYYIEDHAFTEIFFENFAADFRKEFDVDIESYLGFISEGSSLPEFLVSAPELLQTRDDYGDVYLVRLKLTNIGENTGLVDLTFRVPGGGGMGGGPGGMDTEQRFCEVGAGVTKDVQFVFYDQPRMLTVNTLISGNIPSSFNSFLRSATATTLSNLEDSETLSDEPVNMMIEGEIVVDNEDEGFSYVSVSNESKLKKYIDSRKEDDSDLYYQSIPQNWSPAVWTPVSHSGFYGELIRSALLCRKGDGGNKAVWTTVIPDAGFYDVYVYIPVTAMYRGPGRSRRQSQRSGQGGSGGSGGPGGGQRRGPQFADKGTDYYYIVSSNEGVEEVKYTLNSPEDGWNRLGSFHFPADSASIELSNFTNKNRVIADAVKWVKR